jgi:hypothetical protein
MNRELALYAKVCETQASMSFSSNFRRLLSASFLSSANPLLLPLSELPHVLAVAAVPQVAPMPASVAGSVLEDPSAIDSNSAHSNLAQQHRVYQSAFLL